MSRPRLRTIFSARVRTSSSRSASRSISTISDPANAAPCSIHAAIVPGARVEPPPMYATLIPAMGADHTKKDRSKPLVWYRAVRPVLAVDGGNTKTIAVVATDTGAVLSVARGGASDIYGTGSVERGTGVLRAVIAEALDRAGVLPAGVDATVCSLAGADWPEDIELLTGVVAEVGLADPLVVNDAIGGLRSGSPSWEGVAVVAGTFNAVGARNRDGRVFHLGFWPDRTGAFDLGYEALKA